MQPDQNDWQAIVHLARQLSEAASITSETGPKHRVLVTAQGGVAEVSDETQPERIEVEIFDFDNFAQAVEMSRKFSELRDYQLENHKTWG